MLRRLISAAQAWQRTQKVLAAAPAQELRQIHDSIHVRSGAGESHIRWREMHPATVQALEAQGYLILHEREWRRLNSPQGDAEREKPPTFWPWVISWGLPPDGSVGVARTATMRNHL